MNFRALNGCCGAAEIYGFGRSEYDGSRAVGLEAKEFENTILSKIKDYSDEYSMFFVTLNSDQYSYYDKILRKVGFRRVGINQSMLHPTVIFSYILYSPISSLEKTKKRLQDKKIRLKLPKTRKHTKP